MRIVLRLVAVIAALSVLETAYFIVRFGFRGISALLATGAFGVVTLFGWLTTFIAGPIAAVQLFRLRSSGRVAAALLFGMMFAYYAVGLLAFRTPGAPVVGTVALSIALVVLFAIVLTPAARRAVSCNER
jgi:quinol-cytochrome oxidoreductase complex cytochrome b subunit